MTLAFLYPVFWLGALAIAAPLWLHLRRKAEKSLVRFSAVQFLDDLPQARSSPLRLQDPLLFLLRLLGLLLLVAAFTWPYWPGQQTSAISESRVYILDNTLSHRADDGVLGQRDYLRQQLAAAPPDAQIAVVELTSLPRVLVDFGQSRPDALAALDALQPSYQRGSYLAAFRQAYGLLQRSLSNRRRIEFLTDSQGNQWAEAATVAPFLSGVEITVTGPTATYRTNVAVVTPRARRLYLGDKSIVECEVTVLRQGDVPSVQIAVQANGADVGRRTLKFDDESPPAATIAFQWEAPPRERVAGTVTLEAAGDQLDADNQAYFSLPEVREGQVTLVARSTYLRAALSPAVMQGRWSTTMIDDLQSALPAAARDGQVLLIESRYLIAPAGRELVEYFLARQRGVVLLVDQVAPPVQQFLRSQGIEFRSVVDQPTGAAGFRYVLSDHPIFQPFRAPDFGNLLDVQVYRYRRLAAPKAQPLIYSQHGDVLFAQADRPGGKLLVSAFGFDREETNWTLLGTFVPFLDLCLEFARARPELQTHFEPGERCVWSLPEDLRGGRLVVRRGDRAWVETPIVDGRVEFQVPPEPGQYEVSFDGGTTVAHELNVNPSPLESELVYVPADAAVETWKLPESTASVAARSPSATLELTRTEILRQRLWWWLLVAGVVCWSLEMIWLSIRPVGSVP